MIIQLRRYGSGETVLVNTDHIIMVDTDHNSKRAEGCTRISLTHNKRIHVEEDISTLYRLLSEDKC
jgi:hypothetical protein